ncbi:hypothetical protein NC652_028853 [Populus alba x Populus x berolinensis]|uniref:Uncharacterized protein n=1 Tax=Populus alba x Populus x berolinensis TaxID=444605 RepID=A0AAD6Q2E5_9ROSI|nr:hypothetical protein NC652_028853 [Populus alba x Populus x berolinensis]KAJ6976462.1 hypothetical protein NC653_028558 [Populus alba x Populus x berolinensis]
MHAKAGNKRTYLLDNGWRRNGGRRLNAAHKETPLLAVPKWRLVCWLKDDCLNGGPSVLLLLVPLLQGREGCCWRSNLWLKKKIPLLLLACVLKVAEELQ